LLVEDDEFVIPDLLARLSQPQGKDTLAALYRVHKKALLGQALADVVLRDTALHLFEHMTALVCHFDQEFSHGL